MPSFVWQGIEFAVIYGFCLLAIIVGCVSAVSWGWWRR
jgi:hypothetical protein